MLPRRSAVLKYLFVFFIVSLGLFLWLSSTGMEKSHDWRKLLTEMNETQLRVEFERLREEVNASFSSHNKTKTELLDYMYEMQKKVPVNPHRFKYIINSRNVCKDDVFLLIYVHTAPEHYKRRAFIRDTWGNAGNFPESVKVVFLLGKPKTPATQQAVDMESDMYEDIVQEDFQDAYRNLTYKAIMGLKWVTNHCTQARYVLKADDDIFVNIFNLMYHLRSVEHLHPDTHSFLLCLVWYRMKVMRDPKSKWYLSREEFPEDYFPVYCSGSAFIMTTDVIVKMYNASLHTPFFWVDDFYVTGLLAGKIKVQHQKFNSVYSLGPSTFLDKFTEPNKWQNLVFGHVHNLNSASIVWNNILKEKTKQKER